MMIRRSTWILLIVLAVAFALTWFFELSPSAAEEKATPTTSVAELLPGLEPLMVTHIAFSAPQGPNLALTMTAGSQYVFDNPQGKSVNQGAAYQLASELAAIKVAEAMPVSTSLDSIGLDQPALVIEVENARGTRYRLEVGTETPIGTGYYVRVNDGTPVVVDKNALDEIIRLSTLDSLVKSTETPAAPSSTGPPAPKQ